MKKIFTLFVAILATTCLWAQRFQVDGLYYQVVHDGDNSELVLPSVAKPAAGKTTVVLYVPEDTPAGCYAVGSFNWDATNTEKMFTAVEGAQEGWVALTLDWTDGLEFKVLAVPSDEAVTPGWSYQWGKNVDPENDLEEDNVVILQGTGEFVLENQGQPKLKGLADGDVCYIHVKAWATTPVIEAKPCETAAFKHPWGGGDWTYREATKTADATFELNAIFGGSNGVNVATNVNGDGENWYPTENIEFVGDVAAGDSVNIKFVSEKLCIGKLTVTLIEKAAGGEAKDITVKAKVPAAWTNGITAWVWPTGGDGQEVTPTKEGDWYVYTHNCAELNIIFKNGAGWTGDANQTVEIAGLKENTCLQLASDAATKATYTIIDCDDPWYIPVKKNQTASRKSTSSDEKHYVVVTYDKQWSSDNYSYLTTAVIPETIEYMGTTYDVVGIEEGAFAYSPITSVTIPNSIEYIEHGAFSNCYNLTSTFHSGDLASWCDINFQDWGANPTQYSHKLYLNIPGTSYAEEVKGDIVLPNTVDTIPNYAFYGCSGLTSVTIPNSVTSIGHSAFSGCSGLTSVTIPNSVTSIGDNTFADCSGLTSITIPNSVTSIGEDAFEGCSGLTSVTIPESVTEVGDYAFFGCTSLTYLSIPSSVNYQFGWDGSVYYSEGFTSILDCPNLKTLIVPASFFEPEDEWDYTDVVDDYLLYLPAQLETLVLNNGIVPRFGMDFIEQNRHTLKSLDLSGTVYEEMPTEMFYNHYNLEHLTLPSKLVEIPYMLAASCKHLQSIAIPATVEVIGESAFENCRLLSEVNFAEGGALTEIGNWAFYNCHELKNVVIPEGVTNVGYAAFYGCTYLKELTLPASMQSVADNGFALCEKLAKMNVNAVVPPIVEARTFENVDRMIPVVVPTESVSAYKAAPVWQEFNIQGKDPVMSDVENIGSDNGYGVMDNGKIMRNGQLIIIRDGVEYNTLGQAL